MYPKADVIKNKNTGFAGGNNVGIRRAFELGCDYVFLLNPDTTIHKNCLEKLVAKADQQTILQPLILLNIDGQNTDLINTTGGHLNFLGFSYCSDYKKNKSTAREKDIAIASGAAVLIPTNILKKIGLFDENFFMYHEDVDLFYRARLFGFNIRLIPDSLLWHKYSFSRNSNKMFYTDRNRLLFLYKNFSLKYLVLILPISIINEILMILYSLISGWFFQKIRAYFSALALLGPSSTRRKTNLPQIRKRERTLKQFIGPEISFSEVANSFLTFYNLITKIYWYLIKPSI
jgi:GT2 family glycosyltransferase